jgi:hypothetical protein
MRRSPPQTRHASSNPWGVRERGVSSSIATHYAIWLSGARLLSSVRCRLVELGERPSRAIQRITDGRTE